MLEGLSVEEIRETLEATSRITEIMAEAKRLADVAWERSAESDEVMRTISNAESIGEKAWASALNRTTFTTDAVAEDKENDVAERIDDIEGVVTSEADNVVHRTTSVEDGVVDPLTQAIDSVVEVTIEKISCINEHYEGMRHPITGVRYVRKVIEQESGKVIEGVFPEFDSLFDAKIGRELFGSHPFQQIKECNRQLLEAMDKNPELRDRFTAEQLEQIKDGVTTGQAPDGFVWHHNEREGVMQLVDSSIHANTRHTGGHSIWDHK